MKKYNLIFILMITLLVLFSSVDISYAAVTREDFENEIVKSAKAVASGNSRFVEVADSYDYKHKLTFAEPKARSFYSAEKGSTVLAFNDETFITYVYKEVLGLDMTKEDGSTPYNGFDIYNSSSYGKKKDTTCNYFDKAFPNTSGTEWKAKDIINHKNINANDALRIGDILLDVDIPLIGKADIDEAWIYIGNDQFIGFKDGTVQIKNAEALGNTPFDVFRITDSALSKATLGKVDLTNDVLWDATTISDAIANLHINKVTIEGDDAEIKFVDVNGNAVTPKDIASAISEGAISQYGSSNEVEVIYFKLDYKNNQGKKCTMGSQYQAGWIGTNKAGEVKVSFTAYESSTQNKKFNVLKAFDFLDINVFETPEVFSYWGYEYILQKDHSLYLDIYVKLKGRSEEIIISEFAVANGKEYIVPAGDPDGEHVIDCFSSVVEPQYADGSKPTLQDFLDFLQYGMELPDFVYQLKIQENTQQYIGGDNPHPYELNEYEEIVFTVDKTGTYRITPETFNPNGENQKAEKIYIYKGVTKIGSNALLCLSSGAPYALPIMVSGYQPTGTSDFCIDDDCKDLEMPIGNYEQFDPYLTYPLKAGIPYVINSIPNETGIATTSVMDQWLFKVEYVGPGLNELLDHSVSNDIARVSQNINQYHFGGEENYNIFQRLEFMISYLVRNMANGVVIQMNSALGAVETGKGSQTVSIDTIVFDNYPITRLDFFEQDLKPDQQSDFIQRFTGTINTWYSNFMLIAIMAYLGVLLYMGIRIVLNSTAKNQAMFKEVFLQWVTGVIILFMFPIVIRYAIKINAGFVKIVEKYVVDTNNGSKIDGSEVDTDYHAPTIDSDIADEENKTAEVQQIESNPFKNTDNGYMAIMARRAHVTKRLSYALVYFIMAVQLVIIAVMYYKRLFMIGFLIVLFPVVMVAHILEKVADLKIGGAFGKWTKEILISIFTQSIHAIIYSFAIGTVMAASDANNDWILMLVGVTFLFNGEEILKKILGQSSEAVKSLKETAVKTVATAAIVKKGASMIADNVVGTTSHLGQMREHRREGKIHRQKAKLTHVIGEKPKEYKLPSAERLEHYKPEYTEFGDTKAKELGDSIQVLNYMNYAKPEQIAHALDVVSKYSASGEYPELMQDLNMSPEQLDALQNARSETEQNVVNGKGTKEEIDMNLTMELERIVPEADTQLLKMAIYSQIGKTLPTGATNNKLDASQAAVRTEIDAAKQNYDDMRKRISIGNDKDPTKKIEDQEADKKAVRLLQDIYGQQDRYTKEQIAMAVNVVTLQEAGAKDATGINGKHDALELITAANYVYENRGNDEEFTKMAARVGCDVGDLRIVLAEKISEQGYGVNYRENGRENRKLNPNASKRLKMAVEKADKVLDEVESSAEERKSNSPSTVGIAEIITHNAETARTTDANQIKALEENFENEVIRAKQKWNAEAQQSLNDFTKEMQERNQRMNERKIDGMTAAEHEIVAKAEFAESRKEGFAAVQTTEGVIVGGVLGTVGGAKGAAVGAVIGDSIAEYGTGRRKRETVTMADPNTGNPVKVEVVTRGAFANKFLGKLEDSGTAAKMSKSINAQFVQKAAAKRDKYEQSKENALKNAQAAERLKKTVESAQRNNNNNRNT